MASEANTPDRDELAELREAVRAKGNIPRHVAIIMDGNGRWARKRRLPRVAGHRAGRHSVRRAVEACGRLGVEVLTLYTFSQENWKRPQAEVKALWHFLEEVLGTEREALKRQGVRLTATGELDAIPDRAAAALQEAIEDLAQNEGLVLNLALAYGGRSELVHAARAVARRVAAGEITPEDIDEQTLASGLYQPDLPDPDLVIRTSGEHRLSNFLIWQTAYAEMYFTPVLWPDFSEQDLLEAVQNFQDRERRYGGLSDSDDAGDGDAGSGSIFDPSRWKRLLKVRT